MTERSQTFKRSPWKTLFYGCRSAVRSPAGLEVGEFLFPLLLLSMAFSDDSSDKALMVEEILGVLAAKTSDMEDLDKGKKRSRLGDEDAQKAVNAVLNVRDILQYWVDWKVDGKPPEGSHPETRTEECVWPIDEMLRKMKDLLHKVPLRTCAIAAASVGMHARALRYLEMESRSGVAMEIFDDAEEGKGSEIDLTDSNNDISKKRRAGAGGCICTVSTEDLRLMRSLLGQLDDCDAMEASAEESARLGMPSNLKDTITEKEIYGDWRSALHGYEKALQLSSGAASEAMVDSRPQLESGMLHSLLKLEQLESVLNQVTGLRHTSASKPKSDPAESYPVHLLPVTTEAAWRLGRWDLLREMCTSSASGKERKGTDRDAEWNLGYHTSFSRAMLGVHDKSGGAFQNALSGAKSAVISSMSSAARETYSRCYKYFVRFQCIRELEDAEADLFGTQKSVEESSPATSSWGWASRLELTSPDLDSLSSVVNSRVAISGFLCNKRMEGKLWLTYGRHARKQGSHYPAETALAHAETAFKSVMWEALTEENLDERLDHMVNLNAVQLQLGKLRFENGEYNSALRLLEPVELNARSLLECSSTEVASIIAETAQLHYFDVKLSAEEWTREEALISSSLIFGSRVLQATEWMTESGVKSGAEIMDRYRLLVRVVPKWEKAHLSFARYLDSLLEARITALSERISQKGHAQDDETSRAQVLGADEGCQKYLVESMRYYGNSLCYGDKNVYQALPKLLQLWFEVTSLSLEDLGSKSKSPELLAKQEEANELMMTFHEKIPAYLYYSALPQLVSRVNHRDKDTQRIVKAILQNVLTKFPEQAMWHLAWLLQSQHSARAETGAAIFKGAQKQLSRLEKLPLHDLLNSSHNLFKWLNDLAKYEPKDARAESISIRPWRGDVPLEEFVPPVQAALTLSSTAKSRNLEEDTHTSRDVFSVQVPRMRSFLSKIKVMLSKARPKRLTAFAVPAGLKATRHPLSSKQGASKLLPGDIGEMHFLVKQEAKGDLRKDARVQDLNNVMNRLFADRSSSGGRQKCRLQLRTFSVTCLSEETGILEWVPNTDSFRNVVAASTNPQAAPESKKRKGSRIARFQDPTLRDCFQKCQDVYLKTGNLRLATTMYEDKCLKSYPPVMYWWFVQNFLDPHEWFEARTKFSLSAAAWSAIGHVIGLGDRHSENILIDTSSGQCVHVDFDW
jgi:serine/threonine-protein kinase ATR